MYNNEPNDFLMVFNFGNKQNENLIEIYVGLGPMIVVIFCCVFFQANFFLRSAWKGQKKYCPISINIQFGLSFFVSWEKLFKPLSHWVYSNKSQQWTW